jgi:hypothetical protein
MWRMSDLESVAIVAAMAALVIRRGSPYRGTSGAERRGRSSGGNRCIGPRTPGKRLSAYPGIRFSIVSKVRPAPLRGMQARWRLGQMLVAVAKQSGRQKEDVPAREQPIGKACS